MNTEIIYLDGHTQRDFMLGQLAGNRLNMRLHGLVETDGSIDIERLLPNLTEKSIAYKCGLKNIVVEEVFPQVITLFYKNARSTRERLDFMDAVLARLRGSVTHEVSP